MKALFIHDHYYYRGEGDSYLSRGQYHNSIWKRYIDYFDSLTVIGRDGGVASKTEDGINISSRDDVAFYLFQNMNSIKGLLSGRTNIKNAIAKLVADHDVVILRGISELGTIAYNQAKKQNKFIALEMVSCAWDELWYHGSILAKIYAPIRFLCARKITKNADAVIYVSQNFLQKRYPTKARIEARASNVQISYDAFNVPVICSKKHYKIGLIGTLKNKLKGVDVAIEAVRQLHTRNHDHFTLYILGPGDKDPYQKKINRLGLATHIKLDGIRQTGQPVWEWLREMDLYIQPSFQEGVPRAMIEAMAQGLPVIGSNAGGIPELISSDMIVNRGDANALANKIEMVLANEKLRQTQSDINFKTAHEFDHQILNQIRFEFWSNVKTMAAHCQKE